MRQYVESTADDFAPCPFCGSGSLEIFHDSVDDESYVSCRKCYADGPYAAGAFEAQKKWNRRARAKDPEWIGGTPERFRPVTFYRRGRWLVAGN